MQRNLFTLTCLCFTLLSMCSSVNLFGQCPTLSYPAGLQQVNQVCHLQDLDLSVIVGGANASDVQWSTGATGTTINTGTLTNPPPGTCGNVGSQITFTAFIPAGTVPGCDTQVSLNFIIQILPLDAGNYGAFNPAPRLVVDEDDCTIFMDLCPYLAVEYQLDTDGDGMPDGPRISGREFIGNPPPDVTETYTVQFFVSNPCGTINQDSVDLDNFIGTMTCTGPPECPELTPVNPANPEIVEICSGQSTTLQVAITASLLTTDNILWFDENDNVVQTGGAIFTTPTLTSNECGGTSFGYSAVIAAGSVPDCPGERVDFTVNVTPPPSLGATTVITNENCTISLVGNCPGTTVTYTVDGGPIQTGSTYTANPAAGTTANPVVIFTVSNGCGSAPVSGQLNCQGPPICPDLSPLGSINRTICSGESVDLTVILTGDATPANVTWNNGTVGLTTNTGTLIATDCDGDIRQFTASIPAGVAEGCPAVSVTFTITVLPPPEFGANVVTTNEGCTVSLVNACPGVAVSYSTNGGASFVTGTSYTATPDLGEIENTAVIFSLSDPSNTCPTATLNGQVNCDNTIDCPTLTLAPGSAQNVTICSGDDVDLSVVIDGDLTDGPASCLDVVWTTLQNSCTINTGALTNISECEVVFTYVAQIIPELVPDICPPQEIIFEVTVLPDLVGMNFLTETLTQDDGCTVCVETCDNFDVTYTVDGGAPQTGRCYTSPTPGAGQTISEDVVFTIATQCVVITEEISTNCQGDIVCPTLSLPVGQSPNVTICSGESADLSVVLMGNATPTDIDWSTGQNGLTINTGVLTNTSSCDPMVFPYTATIPAGTGDPTCPSSTLTFFVSVLPQPNAGLVNVTTINGGCTVTATTCPDFVVSYQVDGGSSISGNTYSVTEVSGTVIQQNVVFSVSNSCGTTTAGGQINCGMLDCPSLSLPAGASPNVTICSGQSADLAVVLSGASSALINWSTGQSGPSINTGVLTNTNSCDPLTQTYTASIPAGLNDPTCPPQSITFTVSVLPQPDANLVTVNIVNDGCTAVATTCPDFNVSYIINNQGSPIPGNTYSVNPQSGDRIVESVLFIVSNECGSFNESGLIDCGVTSPPIVTHNRDCSNAEITGIYTVIVTIEGVGPFEITGTISGTFQEGEVITFTVTDGEGYFLNVTDAFGGTTMIDQTSIPACTKTPITLISFDGEVNDQANLLHWVTASEIDNSHFTLFHSVDGTNFEAIAEMDGAGNSSTALSYSYAHKGASAGVNYYYLSQTDFDGTTAVVSEVINLVRGEIDFAFVNVAPIPAEAFVNVSFTAMDNTPAQLRIYDVTGRTVHQETVATNGGINQVRVNTDALGSGMYILAVDNGIETISIKMVKK